MRKCIGLELLAAMSDRSNILFVVEGRKRERQLVERLAEVFGFSAELGIPSLPSEQLNATTRIHTFRNR